jgi:hypothetical protein
MAGRKTRGRQRRYDGDAPTAGERFWHWLFRHRWQLVPVYVAFAVAVLATAGHYTWRTGWTLAGDGVLSVVVAVWCRVGLSGNDRVYVAAGAAAVALWTTWVTWLGWSQWTAGTWVLGTAGVGSLWWTHRSVRARIELQREQERWPDIAKRIGLVGSKLRKIVRKSPVSEDHHIDLNAGHQTHESFNRKRYESARQLPPGSVKGITRDPKNSAHIIVHVTKESPWADGTEQPHPALAGLAGMHAAITDLAAHKAAREQATNPQEQEQQEVMPDGGLATG